MQNSQPFRECRNAFRWIETEENERLRRPIIECSIRLQRPASHVREPFSLSQIKFASFQALLRSLLPLSSCCLPAATHFLSVNLFDLTGVPRGCVPACRSPG